WSSVHNVSPCSSATGPPFSLSTVGSSSSCAPLAARNPSPTRKSRLPCMRRTCTPLSVSALKPAATSPASGSPPRPVSSSSPAQTSNRSPSTYRVSARAASSRRKRKNCRLVLGRSPARCRSEMNSALTSLLVGDHRGGLDHHHLARRVGRERAARAGRRLGDLHHHVHAAHHLAEHRVAPAVLCAGGVEEVVVLQVDEELRGGRMRRAG